MSNPTADSKIEEILVKAFDKGYEVSRTTVGLADEKYIAHQETMIAEAATQLQQLMIEARIDEWDYIETLRELSDNAMYVSMDERIKALQAQLNKEVENGK